MMKPIARHILHLLGGIALLALLVAAVMLLWNALIPEIIGWKAVSYWQALGLVALTHLLLGHLARPSLSGDRRDLRKRLHERFHGMSSDERRAFVRRMHHRFTEERPADDHAER